MMPCSTLKVITLAQIVTAAATMRAKLTKMVRGSNSISVGILKWTRIIRPWVA